MNGVSTPLCLLEVSISVKRKKKSTLPLSETGWRFSTLEIHGISSKENETIKGNLQNQVFIKFYITNKFYSPVFHFPSSSVYSHPSMYCLLFALVRGPRKCQWNCRMLSGYTSENRDSFTHILHPSTHKMSHLSTFIFMKKKA